MEKNMVILHHKIVNELIEFYIDLTSTISDSISNYKEYELNDSICNHSKKLINFKNVAYSIKNTADYYKQLCIRDMDRATIVDISNAYQEHKSGIFTKLDIRNIDFDFIKICKSRIKALNAVSIYSDICNNVNEIQKHYEIINNHIVNHIGSTFNEKIDAYSRCACMLEYNFKQLAKDFKKLCTLSSAKKYEDEEDYYCFDYLEYFELYNPKSIYDEDDIPF